MTGEIVTTADQALAPFTCGICGARKGESNHWYVLFLANIAGRGQLLEIYDWSPVWTRTAGTSYCAVACGEACVHQLVGHWLETRTFAAPKVRSEPAQKEGSC